MYATEPNLSVAPTAVEAGSVSPAVETAAGALVVGELVMASPGGSSLVGWTTLKNLCCDPNLNGISRDRP